MAKPEWGVKRTCLACGSRFYDFSRQPIICPECEAEFLPDAALKPRRSRAAPEPAKVAVVAAAANDDEVETTAAGDDDLEKELATIENDDDVDSDDAEDSVIEDTSDLGGDDDDLGEVAGNIVKPNED